MKGARKPFWRRRWFLWTAASAAVAFVVLLVVLDVVARRVEPFLRSRIVSSLEERFHTRVELDQFHVAVHHGARGEWGIWATGSGMRIWPAQAVGDDPASPLAPLIQLDQFAFHVPLRLRSPQVLHISEIRLTGLRVLVPPKSRLRGPGAPGAANQPQPASAPGAGALSGIVIVVDRIACEHAVLVLETDKPGKLPLDYDIARLTLTNLVRNQAMHFDAELTNARPRGLIDTAGNFGPIDTADLGDSPVNGNYRLTHADLSTFRGIAGFVSSTGNYSGTLRAINVDGQADVPDFALSHFGSPAPLHTAFHARVDGTNGDTWLDHVDATLGHAAFSTSGQIVRVRNSAATAASAAANQHLAGHLIDLAIVIPHAPVEDFLRIVTKSGAPVLTGLVESRAQLHIPPGPAPIHERMRLDGSFHLDNVRFTSEKIQSRIEELSLRGLGHPGDLKTADPGEVRSEMQSTFHLAGGSLALPGLVYSVPGATINLKGTYALDGALDFTGAARMQATISKMVGGWKGMLLKPADRFFEKHGAGTFVPIRITGTRESPQFGLDFGKGSSTHPERPGSK
jgi:hypothetical protein